MNDTAAIDEAGSAGARGFRWDARRRLAAAFALLGVLQWVWLGVFLRDHSTALRYGLYPVAPMAEALSWAAFFLAGLLLLAGWRGRVARCLAAAALASAAWVAVFVGAIFVAVSTAMA